MISPADCGRMLMSKGIQGGRLWFLSLAAAMGGLLFGYDTAAINGGVNVETLDLADVFKLMRCEDEKVGCQPNIAEGVFAIMLKN